MRIIAGKYKGNLVSFDADHIRPTTDRVKESLFNILQHQIDGAQVLDLFSGTGSLGLEALSRGASTVTFVEKNKKSIDILKKNIEKLKIQEPTKIINKDVFDFFKKQEEAITFDLIFADPPFAEILADAVMLAASKSTFFHENTIMVIESGRREKIEDDYGTIVRYDVREFGDKFLSFFHKKGKHDF